MATATELDSRIRVKNTPPIEYERTERGSDTCRSLYQLWRCDVRQSCQRWLALLAIAMTYPFSALAYYSGTNMRDTNFFAKKINGSIVMFGENRLDRFWSNNGLCGVQDNCPDCGMSCYGHEIDNAVAYSTTSDAAAVILADGSVFSWGSFCCGTTIESTEVDLTSDVSSIASTNHAFAALKTTGAIVTWGDEDYGGDSSDIETSLESGCAAVTSNYYSFAALKNDGSVVTWGYSTSNYGADSSSFTGSASSLSSVSEIFSTSGAFAALTSTGSVACWGHSSDGGDCSSSNLYPSSSSLTSVSRIYSTYYAFAALLSDSTVVTWGQYASSLTSGLASVTKIFSNYYSFAALHSDGTVSAWGDSLGGGSTSSLSPSGSVLTSVTMIYGNNNAFAALKSDGSVVCWGSSSNGGNCDSSDLITDSSNDLSSNVVYIAASQNNFAALKNDGSVVLWGQDGEGNAQPSDINSNDIDEQLASGVIAIHSHQGGFGILKSNQSAYFWGYSIYDGYSADEVETIFGSNEYFSLSDNPKAPDGCATGASTLSIATDGTMTTSSSCTACTAGMYDATVACLPCPYNSYSSSTSSTGCTKCAVGMGAAARGSSVASDCIACTFGKFSNSSGSSCENCAVGSYSSSTGSSFCPFCEAGTSNSEVGASCDACPAGQTSWQYRYWDNGRYTPTVSGCVDCKPGTFLASGGVCEQVPSGHISDGISIEKCAEDDEVKLDHPPVSREYCYKCPSFYYSDCQDHGSRAYEVWHYYTDPNNNETFGYSTAFILSCRHTCSLFSLDVDEGPLSGLVVTLAVLFLCCFYYCRTPKEVIDVKSTLQDLEEREEALEKGLDGLEEGEKRERSHSDNDSEESDKLSAHAHKLERKTKQILVFDLVLAGKLFVYVAIPVLDTFTDLAYVCGARFYGVLFFALAFFFFMVPNIAFCRHLYLVGMRPKLLLPCYSIVPKSVQFEDYDNLVKVLVGMAVNFPWILLNIPYLLIKLVPGMFLYSTKVLAIGGVQTKWNRWWTGTDEYAVWENIDVHMLNESIYVEILAETFPQVIIQILNHTFINKSMTTGWDLVSGASILVTILNTFNGLWKLLYYKAIKGINLDDIPVDFAIAQIIESDETQNKDEFVFKLHDDTHEKEGYNGHHHRDAHHHNDYHSDEDSEGDHHLAWVDSHHSNDDDDHNAHNHGAHHPSNPSVSERLGLLEAHYKELAEEQKLMRVVLNEHSEAIKSAAIAKAQMSSAISPNSPGEKSSKKPSSGVSLSKFVKTSMGKEKNKPNAEVAIPKEETPQHARHTERDTEAGDKEVTVKAGVI